MPPGLKLRLATPGDAPAIQRVHEDSIRGAPGNIYGRAELGSWASGLKADRYVWAMNHLDEIFLVADVLGRGGELAGFCSYDECDILGLYIHPAWMGRGLASIMMDRAENTIIATGMRFIGISASRIARPLYEKRGYVVWRQHGWKTRGGLVMEDFDMEKKIAGAARPTPAIRSRARRSAPSRRDGDGR